MFGKERSEGNAGMKALLGGKGANLAEMSRIGLSVPPGLTITTETCAEYGVSGRQLPPGCWEDVLQGLKQVEGEMGSRLGSADAPLLLSVRSGAAVSIGSMQDGGTRKPRLPNATECKGDNDWSNGGIAKLAVFKSATNAPSCPARSPADLHARHDGHCAEPGAQ